MAIKLVLPAGSNPCKPSVHPCSQSIVATRHDGVGETGEEPSGRGPYRHGTGGSP